MEITGLSNRKPIQHNFQVAPMVGCCSTSREDILGNQRRPVRGKFQFKQSPSVNKYFSTKSKVKRE